MLQRRIYHCHSLLLPDSCRCNTATPSFTESSMPTLHQHPLRVVRRPLRYVPLDLTPTALTSTLCCSDEFTTATRNCAASSCYIPTALTHANTHNNSHLQCARIALAPLWACRIVIV